MCKCLGYRDDIDERTEHKLLQNKPLRFRNFPLLAIKMGIAQLFGCHVTHEGVYTCVKNEPTLQQLFNMRVQDRIGLRFNR